jgi:carbonic anhydrase
MVSARRYLKPILLFSIIMFGGCTESGTQAPNEETKEPAATTVGLVEDVLTEEEQAALTPDMVIQSLTEGNERFVRNDLTSRNHSAQVRQAVDAQFPKAIVLSCVDSRVPVEDVFDRGIGDIFVARVAGNFVNTDILGSMEFACKVAGAKLVLVLGHENCGAVKAAIANVEMGNITPMLTRIRAAGESVTYDGARNADNAEFVHAVCEANVRQAIAQIRSESDILRELESAGQIKLVGAIYDMDTGRVEFLPPAPAAE